MRSWMALWVAASVALASGPVLAAAPRGKVATQEGRRQRARKAAALRRAARAKFGPDDFYRRHVVHLIRGRGASGASQLYRAIRRAEARGGVLAGGLPRPLRVAAGARGARFSDDGVYTNFRGTGRDVRVIVEAEGPRRFPSRTRTWFFDARTGALVRARVTNYHRNAPRGWTALGSPSADPEAPQFAHSREYAGAALEEYARRSAGGDLRGVRFGGAR
jgi:hypothetical protein